MRRRQRDIGPKTVFGPNVMDHVTLKVRTLTGESLMELFIGSLVIIAAIVVAVVIHDYRHGNF